MPDKNYESFRDVGGLHAASCAANRKILACCGGEIKIFYCHFMRCDVINNLYLRPGCEFNFSVCCPWMPIGMH